MNTQREFSDKIRKAVPELQRLESIANQVANSYRDPVARETQRRMEHLLDYIEGLYLPDERPFL